MISYNIHECLWLFDVGWFCSSSNVRFCTLTRLVHPKELFFAQSSSNFVSEISQYYIVITIYSIIWVMYIYIYILYTIHIYKLFGTIFVFPYIGNNNPSWLILFRGVETTNQRWVKTCYYIIAIIWLQMESPSIRQVWRRTRQNRDATRFVSCCTVDDGSH